MQALEPRLALAAAPVSDTLWDYHVLVRFTADASQSAQTAAINAVGGTVVKSYSGGLKGLKEISLQANTSTGLNQALATLNANPRVRYAERNQVWQASVTPNDARFDELYGMNNTGQSGGQADADIDAVEAWDTNTGSKSVIVAVVDTGTDYTHPDLAANMWSNPLETADGIDNDNNGYIDDLRGWDTINGDNDPMDDDSHGTHVAGTIGAVGNNGEGVVGVNWNVSIMPLKFLGPAGGSTAGAIEAIDYITQMKLRGENVVVSNNSWGGGGFSQALLDAINVHGAAGIIFAAAAGNGGVDGVGDNNDLVPEYPTSFNSEAIISVAATDDRDQLGGFSNYGATSVDLSAPGVAVLSTVPLALDPAGYDFFDGTSMATPQVSGAIGLLAAEEPTLTSADIKALIFAGVDVVPALNGRVLTGGRLNIARSLSLIPRGVVQGTVFTDKAGDGVIQAADTPLPGATVYYDANANGVFDAGEKSDVTNASGNYTITRLPDPIGGIQIRVVPPPLYVVTVPPSGVHVVDFAFNAQVITGINFGVFGPPGEIHGTKWYDANGNASLDPAHGDGPWGDAQRPFPPAFIYVDIDNDGRAGIGEPAAVTSSDGTFIIKNVPVGTYFLREVTQPGFAVAFPIGAAHQFTMTPRAILTGFDFFNSPAHDWGDAPNSYQTLRSSNGPVHGYKLGYGLGTIVDADANGNPNPLANGDDTVAFDDEDGVQFLNLASPGRAFNFQVKVMVPNFTQPGYLNAWMDFNRDGDFADSGEKIIGARQLGAGTFQFSTNVPSTAVVGQTYMRFRYSAAATVGFAGSTAVGEVEDYAVGILGATPTANDDFVTVQQFSVDNKIFVLANDVASVNGPARLVHSSVPGSSQKGGTITIGNNGTPNNFTDDFIFYDAAPAYGTGRTYADSFTYTITDGTTQRTATVHITVNKVSTSPNPVDDIFAVAGATGATTTFNVLANDNPGTDRGTPLSKISLYSFDTNVRTEAGTVIGTISRNTNGTPNDLTDDRLTFTARAGAAGQTGQFKYAVRNPNVNDPAVSKFANVTLQVRPNNVVDSNDDIKLSIQVKEVLAGGGIGTDAGLLVQGQQYWVGIYSDDLRPAFEFQNNPGVNANGALSVYLDLLFNRNYVRPDLSTGSLQIRYNGVYNNSNTGRSGAAATGLIDELGVTSGSPTPAGPSNTAVMFVKFNAVAATPGTTPLVLFKTDPADERSTVDPANEHDIIVNDEVDTTNIRDVEINNVAYFQSSPMRVIGASAPAASPANVAPTLVVGVDLGYQLNTAPITLSLSGTVRDPDSGNFAGGMLQVRISDGAGTGNRLTVGGPFVLVNREVRLNGTVIGRLASTSSGVGTQNLDIYLTANANAANVQTLLRSIRFGTVNATLAGTRKIEFTLWDGDGGQSATVSKRVFVKR